LHRLSDYRGKVVLVNFWATWCEPCRDEMPSMQRLKERFENDRRGAVVILAVNYAESAASVDKFLKTVRLDFPVLLDPFSEVSRHWKPGILPATYLVGRDGRIHYRALGELDWAGAEAVAVIERLLAQSS
jgi:thiol-disulfide isomerase/thioredoxin